jgi:hypothetical protein
MDKQKIVPGSAKPIKADIKKTGESQHKNNEKKKK